MKLLTAQQLQQWDAYTIQHEPVASIDLMERAAIACTNWLIEKGFARQPVKIFCGKGNNGGDGLAIARLLIQSGVQPVVYIIEFGSIGTSDFQQNLQRLHQLTTDIHFIQSDSFFPVINASDVVVDALFGTGLNRPLHNLGAALVEHINAAAVTVVAIDVPSGMAIDKSLQGNTVIRAKHTLTFESLKLCFLSAVNAAFFGEVVVLTIGLYPGFSATVDVVFAITERKIIADGLKPRDRFSHKGKYGHALLLAGNKGKMGAAVLAAKACLRSGVGLLTVAVPEAGLQVIQTAVPEAMAMVRNEAGQALNPFTTIGAGPGLGTATTEQAAIETLLQQYARPLVLDADALNILSQHTSWLVKIPAGSLLTPHPKEFDRLFGVCADEFERWQKAISLSVQYPFIILLKGHYTLVAAGGKGWFNSTGNAGMAKGGSGDVLTGILTALLAQGYEPLQAAVTGAYLHGLAADLALEKQAMESLLPTDIIDALGNAFNFLKSE